MAMPRQRTSGIRCRQSSGKPVDKIMESLVVQPGEPLLTFGSVHDGKVEVTQKRFFLNPKDAAAQEQTWVLPVCIKSCADQPDCPIMNAAHPAAAGAASAGFLRQRRWQGLLSQPLRQRRLSTTVAPGGDQPYAVRADYFSGQPMGAGPRRHRAGRGFSESRRRRS